MAEKKRSVGLIVTTEIDGELVAILQVRGTFNPEKMKPESWPGACQVTVHGGCNTGENESDALMRETDEELGNDATDFIIPCLANAKIVFKAEDEKKAVTTTAMRVLNPDFLKAIRLHAGSGGIRLVSKDDLPKIQDLSKFDKTEGVIDRRVIAMFPDELEALKKALA